MHGHIKPSNILIDENDDAVISDYESSRRTDGLGSSRVGGMDYLAPEVADKFQKESDMFAFALTAVELFAGKLPYFKGDSTPSKRLIARSNTKYEQFP